MKFCDVRSSLLDIEEVIRGDKFESWRRSFVRDNVRHFSYDDENKLEYTDIHREYEEEIERAIAEGLGRGFDMADFMQSLPGYLESEEGLKDERAGLAVTLLLEVSDFEQFRAMMVYKKREYEEASSKAAEDSALDDMSSGSTLQGIADSSAAFDVEGMMALCGDLMDADGGEGWVQLVKLDWMRIDKKAVEKGRQRSKNDIYLRGKWTMSLSYTEACDMMFSMDERRKAWDGNFKGVKYHTGDAQSNDAIMSASLNFGYLMNLVMFGDSAGTVLSTRNIRVWESPSKNSVTYAMIPWNIKENCFDKKHKLLSLKVGTIAAHSTEEGKVVMTSLEINSMGGLPKWALGFMASAAPSMMKSLEQKYITNARKKGISRDCTQRGRGGAGADDKGNRK